MRLKTPKFLCHSKAKLQPGFMNGFRFQRDPEVKATLQNVLFQIGTAFNIIANDWNLGEIIDLISMEKVEAYLNSRYEN